MQKHLYYLSIMFLLFTVLLKAQNTLSLSSEGKQQTVKASASILYEQMDGTYTNAITSQNFESALDSYDNQAADDFLVPSGDIWYIESIDILGAYFNGSGPLVSVNIWIYNDSSGFPGSTAAEILEIVPSSGIADGSLGINLVSPIVLNEGSYWISIQANMDYSAGGQFGWVEQGQSNNPSVWRNPGGGFGTSCSNWNYRVSTCNVGTAPDLAFRLNGNANIVPVELTSFSAAAKNNIVELKWTTASETNNQGFEVQRNSGNGFVTIGFVGGFGTTTEIKNYNFIDKNINTGSYSYRLKQIDFDGTFEYSKVINVEVKAPVEFGLDQNFPNPFNPSTSISFSLAVDSKVKINVYNLLGQQVAALINSELTAGKHDITFDASDLNSGVYFYKIEANGNDGQNFISTKKMILTK